MANLIAIDPEPISASIVDYLENLIERARAGQFSAVAAAYVYRDGSTGSGYSDQHNLATMVGSVEALKVKLVRDTTDGD
jgi:hypothetical protein